MTAFLISSAGWLRKKRFPVTQRLPTSARLCRTRMSVGSVMNKSKTIAIDLDEVLGFFIDPLCDFHNETYDTKLRRADFKSYAFADTWGGTRDQGLVKVHKFFESSHFADIPRVPGATEGVRRLREAGFELVIVTSRQHIIEQRTREWVARHFPGVFRDIAFGNHWGLEGKKTSKKDLCLEMGACALVDDSLGYATEIADAGLAAILFDFDGTYGWNKTVGGAPDPRGVRRVQNWDQVVHALCDRI